MRCLSCASKYALAQRVFAGAEYGDCMLAFDALSNLWAGKLRPFRV